MAYLFGVSEPEKLKLGAGSKHLIFRLPSNHLVIPTVVIDQADHPAEFEDPTNALEFLGKEIFPGIGLKGIEPVYLGQAEERICRLCHAAAVDLGISRSNGEPQLNLDEWKKNIDGLRKFANRLNIQYGALDLIDADFLSEYVKSDFGPSQQSFSGRVLYRVSKDNWRLRLIIKNGAVDNEGSAWNIYSVLLAEPSSIKRVAAALLEAAKEKLPCILRSGLPVSPHTAVLEKIGADRLTWIGVIRNYRAIAKAELPLRERQVMINIRSTPKAASALEFTTASLVHHFHLATKQDGLDPKQGQSDAPEMADHFPLFFRVLRTR
ncbi:MAG: hypothetical protein AB7G80_09360 [Dongiaceae bacterium]